VDVDEVRSAGVLGLMDAVEGFDLSRGIKFETYCSLRVRGSILDELRSRDWVPRLVRNRAQKFAVAVRKLQATFGRAPTPQEVMAELAISPEDYEELQRDLARLAVYSLSQSDDDSDENHASPRFSSLVDRRHEDPISRLEKREAARFVFDGVDRKEREILALYYFHGQTMKEIGRRLGLSESRVCQIHSEVLNRLRDVFTDRLAASAD
jgi:RNA polymerase sigma factor for flagellar operon FliA